MPFDAPGQTRVLTQTIKVELVKPLDCSWEMFGTRLRVLRNLSHQMVNAGIIGRITNSEFETGFTITGYVREAIERYEEYKGESVDVPAAIADACQRRATQMADAYLKNRRDVRIPSCKFPFPILFRDGGWMLDEGGSVIRLKLYGDRGGWHRVALAASSGWHRGRLRRMADGVDVKLGSAQVKYDERKRKWYAFLAYSATEPVPDALDKDTWLAVNRGRHCFLYMASTTGHAKPLRDGRDLLEFKRRIGARRSAMKAHHRELGAGAKGHGKRRRYRTYTALEDKEARYVQTYCQQTAAALVKEAAFRGAGTVLVEDFNTIESEDLRFVPSWPWFQLKQAITWACTKAGIEVVECSSEYISSTCPKCGNVGEKQHNLRTGTFRCGACPYVDKADRVATLNMLDMNGADMKVWRRYAREEKALADKLRGASADGATARPECERSQKTGSKPTRKPPTKRGSRKSPRKGSK